MLTCKDCLCYAACGYHITEETDFTVNECSTGFKNKEEYIKLPAYIGQPVWTVSTWFGGRVEIQEGKVSMLQQKADKSWKFRATINSSVCDYTLKDVGIRIFFSEDEAIEEHDRRVRELDI